MSFLREFWAFLCEREKFWMWPIILVLLLIGGLIVLAQGSAVAPFVYTFFWTGSLCVFLAYYRDSAVALIQYARISPKEIDRLVFHDKPFLKFERLLETYVSFAPKGLNSFRMAIPL